MEDAKRAAAIAALDEIPAKGHGDVLVVGLGTGSTARLFVEELGARVKAGLKMVGVPTSEATRAQAKGLGIPLLDDEGPWDIDVTIDGADEVSDGLDLIKGGGAAHTREKVVNFASRRNVIIVDAGKMSPKLGVQWPVPTEVLPFAHGTTRAHLARLGNPVLRVRDGKPVKTDAGNLIFDLQAGTIDDPGALDRAMRAIPGVVETGLFVGRADVVLVAGAGGVKRLARST
ncbi:MAG TPA: ribose-5-phosphate isomerase RpiA [Polyangiaceae bacterium]|jgi:ribose 5-phosphate isomerase A|nr:ribose-5-phosphate isomerase RpiA [Polyangiaceae bacterium]